MERGKTHTQDQQMQPTPTLSATEYDVKPDTKVFHCKGVGGDFMSRVSKGGKRLFIEESPQTSSTADEGKLSGSTVGVNSPHTSVRSTGEEDLNDEVRSRDGTEGYRNTTTHPTCIPQPPDGQNFVHNPAASEVIQRWETNTRCLTWPGVTQAGEVNTEIWVTHRSRLFDDRPRFQNVKDKP